MSAYRVSAYWRHDKLPLNSLQSLLDENVRNKTTFSPIVAHVFFQTALGKEDSPSENSSVIRRYDTPTRLTYAGWPTFSWRFFEPFSAALVFTSSGFASTSGFLRFDACSRKQLCASTWSRSTGLRK